MDNQTTPFLLLTALPQRTLRKNRRGLATLKRRKFQQDANMKRLAKIGVNSAPLTGSSRSSKSSNEMSQMDILEARSKAAKSKAAKEKVLCDGKNMMKPKLNNGLASKKISEKCKSADGASGMSEIPTKKLKLPSPCRSNHVISTPPTKVCEKRPTSVNSLEIKPKKKIRLVRNHLPE